MKKIIRFISGLLTAIMLVGVLAGLSVVEISAAPNKEKETIEDKLKKYLTTEYDSPQKKLTTMQLKLEKDGYQLWADEMSGEVACVDLKSGQILSTNPYDIATTKGSVSTKEQLMSQIVIRYVDNDQEKNFYSFKEASYRGQIKVKNIKGGIRVEYTIGREETRMLLPRMIRKERFEENILKVVAEATGGYDSYICKKLLSYYPEQNPDLKTSERAKAEMYAVFPITKKFPIYLFAPDASEVEKRRVEAIIKTYCPLYTYEELDKDHEETEYEGTDRAPALFKMALEYTLDKDGMTVRLPANGIRFDESQYQLTYVSILPYMGAGANYAGKDPKKVQTGYTFYPDGSGSIFRFENLANMGTTTISGKVYGYDYAYHTITGAHQEAIRYPAFGLVANDIVTEQVEVEEDGKKTMVSKDKEVSRGYLAVIEEGDALAEIYTYHAGALSKYNTMQMMFYPRPKDTYNMKDAISVGSNATWTVVSKRKYVGNYKIRYFMLTDDEIAKEKDIDDYYETSWLGMAVAYREYLDSQGILTRLKEGKIKDDIPLYIETFGALDTIKKVMSIPINTKVALTSFNDIIKMYDELSEDGIENINFKLTGYANGGMYSKMPYRLKWERSVGSKKNFENLVEAAKKEGFGVYPDFEFVYAQRTGNFDGLSLKKHLVKTIDNRYTAKREYSPTYQTFVSYFHMAVSPAYYSHFYEKLSEKYLKYGYGNISIGSLGSDLSSDFDEDEPYNREDNKDFTIKALKYFDENYDSVMVTGGNAYTWKYVDHILDVSLDSSRYNRSSNSVPFIGVLLHGYIQFAGTPLNMEGNIGYSTLRTIENGASPYFILSYNSENTGLLKEDPYLSKYYSVRYDIWHDELVDIYKRLNDVLSDVQTKLIIDHEFLVGERVPDADEIESDINELEKELQDALDKAESEANSQAIKDILNARQTAKNNALKIETLLEEAKKAAEDAKASIAAIEAALLNVPESKAAYEAALAAEEAAKLAYDTAKQESIDARDAYIEINKTGDDAAKQAAKDKMDAASKAEKDKKAEYNESSRNRKAAEDKANKADSELRSVLNAGIAANEKARNAAEQAKILAGIASEAASFISTVTTASAEIKAAANQYAESAEKNAALTAEYAAKALRYASAAIAISSDTTVDKFISIADKAEQDAKTRAEDIKVKYDKVISTEETLKLSITASEEARKAFEEAVTAYEAATAKAALDTATEADKKAAMDAGTIMNEAKSLYDEALATMRKNEVSHTSAITFLRNSLLKLRDERDKVLKAKEDIENAIESTKQAIADIETLEGVNDIIETSANASYAKAVESSKKIDAYVESLNKIYDENAEYVKKYVVIEEVTETQPENTVESEKQPEKPEYDTTDKNHLYDDYEYTKYTNDNGNIVKVTYGDTDANGKYLPYKTFLLNYNFFDVTVVYNNEKYTIPATGYVVFYH